MKTKIETINKERANYYLSINPNNRPVSPNKVNQYYQDIIDNKWKENTGEAIKISKEGYLIDGQHRLLALTKADRELSFLVVYDLDRSVFDVLDTGKPRGANDVFALNNIVNSTVTVSILRGYISFKSGKYYLGSARDSNIFTNSAILSKYNENAEYYDLVTRQSLNLYHSFNKILMTSTIGTFYLLFKESNPDKCTSFFNQLCGCEIITNSSIKTLQNFLIKDKISLKKISPTIKYIFIVKTWNAFVLGKENKVLRFDQNVEKFPVIL